MGLNLTIPLVKIDEERRLVVGRAVQEIPDRSGEILDYESAKPAFEEWSKSFEIATGGLSKGNVRVMHNPKVVAGKVVELHFNDEDRAIDVVAKIVDDQEWRKVLEGVYTGFSVGGAYARKWKDGSLTRYTPKVSEISLVDRPCIPTCTIAELHKADGRIEELRLTGRPPRTYGEIAKAAPRTFAQIRRPRTYGELEKVAALGRAARYLRRNKSKIAVAAAAGALGLGTAYAADRAFRAILPRPVNDRLDAMDRRWRGFVRRTVTGRD